MHTEFFIRGSDQILIGFVRFLTFVWTVPPSELEELISKHNECEGDEVIRDDDADRYTLREFMSLVSKWDVKYNHPFCAKQDR